MPALEEEPTRYSMGWYDLKDEFLGCESRDTELLHPSEGFTKKYKGQQIVLLVDEICNKHALRELGEQSFPETMRIILILNPRESEEGDSLTLSPSFLHVTITTPYRSRHSSIMEMITRARTHLAVILVNCYAETKGQFLKAEKKGLINLVHLGASNGNGYMDEDNKSQGTNAELIDDVAQDTREGLVDIVHLGAST